MYTVLFEGRNEEESIDGVWSTIEMTNLDRLSSVGNDQINAEVESAEGTQQMEALFTCDVANAWE